MVWSIKTVPVLTADCFLEYERRTSFAKLVWEMDDLMADLQGTAEEGIMELTNVQFKDLDAIERELSNYMLEMHCRFTFEESKWLLHIRYASTNTLYECIRTAFSIDLDAGKISHHFAFAGHRQPLYHSAATLRGPLEMCGRHDSALVT